VDHEYIIVYIVTRLLFDQNKISVLYFRFHTISFSPDEKTFTDIFDAEHCYRRRYLFLGIFIYDGFSFVSTLSETVDGELDDIIQVVRDILPDQSISLFVFYEISFQYQLIQFIQYGLRMASPDIVSYFSQGDSFLIRVLFEEGNQRSLDVIKVFCGHGFN